MKQGKLDMYLQRVNKPQAGCSITFTFTRDTILRWMQIRSFTLMNTCMCPF